MPFSNNSGQQSSWVAEAAPNAGNFGDGGTPRPWTPCCPYFRFHSGEPCPETVLLMPFVVFLFLALELRTWLRQRIGQKVGNVIGGIVVVSFGGPPLLVGCAVVLLMRCAMTLLAKPIAE